MAHLSDFIGYLYILLGVSLLLQPTFWIDYTQQLKDNPTRMVSLGVLTLMVGLWIVLVHPAWTASLDVLITIAGWLMLIKGVSLLSFSQFVLKIYPLQWMTPLVLRIQAILIIALGGVFVCYVP